MKIFGYRSTEYNSYNISTKKPKLKIIPSVAKQSNKNGNIFYQTDSIKQIKIKR
jgi:hypothetical protein